jgi:hypothetical protein
VAATGGGITGSVAAGDGLTGCVAVAVWDSMEESLALGVIPERDSRMGALGGGINGLGGSGSSKCFFSLSTGSS